MQNHTRASVRHAFLRCKNTRGLALEYQNAEEEEIEEEEEEEEHVKSREMLIVRFPGIFCFHVFQRVLRTYAQKLDDVTEIATPLHTKYTLFKKKNAYSHTQL